MGNNDDVEMSQAWLDGDPVMPSGSIAESIMKAKQKEEFVRAVGEAAWVAKEEGVPMEVAKADLVILPGKSVQEASDGHHTFNDLYRIRALLTAALFNEWWRSSARNVRNVHKSKLHHDGTMFKGGWFVVMAELRQSDGSWKQISFHYEMAHWDLFRVYPKIRAMKWDGHDHIESYRRLGEFSRCPRTALSES